MLKKVFKDDELIEKYSSDNSSDNSTGIKKEIGDNSEKHIAIISSIFGLSEEEKVINDNESSYKDWYNSLVKKIKDINDINIPEDMIKEIKE